MARNSIGSSNRFIDTVGNATAKILHYMKFAELLGIPSQPIEWHFELHSEEEEKIDILLDKRAKQYAVLFVGTRWQSKRWFPRQMADCAGFLWKNHNLEVILLGGKEDRRIADEVLNCYSGRVRNPVGRTSLREALGLIARAHVAVGPDTGLMHIAARPRHSGCFVMGRD
jgi:ADP-heptose:LPS heptosyltransferase